VREIKVVMGWALVLALCIGLFSARANAQQMPALPTGVRIVLATCDRIVNRGALLEQLRIELLSTGVVDIEVVDPDTGAGGRAQDKERIATLQVYYPECDDSGGLVNLRITDRLTAKYVERTLVVSDVPLEARSRAVALAIVELLRASWLELVISQGRGAGDSSDAVRSRLVTRLKAATEEDPDENEDRKSARGPEGKNAPDDAALSERWHKTRLEWLGGSRLYPSGDSGDLTTTVKLSFPLNRRLRLHTGGLAAGGQVNGDNDINMFEGAGLVGVGITGGSGPELEVASIFEVGWARLSGESFADVGRTFSVGTLQGTLRQPVTPGVDVIFGVQAGYVLSSVVARSMHTKLGGFEGPVIGVLLGLSGML
jgi:hypothetical protein